ncbi:hypothetical protein PILCRDRAFT_812754 [Piloderma croceum F 1598]|uniref:Uncharacterized protein n=1 Tax=Piloderma croceum (strain F 1598) TaxID=765440 RepID=A0A0C3GH59_PILCF|nr:hypothetical protein PILCRDRAFT_812754 [Piloderma croceum F 1598]
MPLSYAETELATVEEQRPPTKVRVNLNHFVQGFLRNLVMQIRDPCVRVSWCRRLRTRISCVATPVISRTPASSPHAHLACGRRTPVGFKS